MGKIGHFLTRRVTFALDAMRQVTTSNRVAARGAPSGTSIRPHSPHGRLPILRRKVQMMITQAFKEKALQVNELVQRILNEEAIEQGRTRVQDAVKQLSARFSWGGAEPAATNDIGSAEAAAEKLVQRVATRELEELSRAELYALACELDVRGRKNLRKADLIDRIREAQTTN